MIQSLHIFRKDLRHLWPELSLYAALLLAFCWAVPQTWEGADIFNPTLQIFLVLLRVLFPILWLVLITRLMHDEPLVGDQQFWITRPYKRFSLLSAKLLFIVACIILPFAAMQCWLLFHAGLHPFSNPSGLFYNLLYLALLTWLPFAAIASVTSTFPRAAMSAVGALVGIFVFFFIAMRQFGVRVRPPYSNQTVAVLLILLLAGVLLWQYRTRRTLIARVVLIATPFVLGIAVIAAPADLLFRHHYPLVSGLTEPAFAFDPDPSRYESQLGRQQFFLQQAVINVPLQNNPRPGDTSHFNTSADSFTLDAPGFHYASPWEPAVLNHNSLSLIFPEDVLTRLHGAPVHMHLTFVAERLTPGSPQTITANDRFDAPSNGNCIFPADMNGAGPFCRYPFQDPPPITVTGTVSIAPCGAGGATHPGIYNFHSLPLQPTFDPLITERLSLGGVICSGTPLTFTTYQSAGNLRQELDIPSIILNHYVAHIPPRPTQGMPSTTPATPPAGAAKPAH